MMSLFAHTETGKALDPQEADDADGYLKRFSGIDTDAWQVKEVPAGTQHGATPNGQGGWNNPPQPAPAPPTPGSASLDKTEFLLLLAANNGDLAAALKNWP
jgi:hypothetical protein